MIIRYPYSVAIAIFIFLFFSCQNEESLIGNSFLNDGQYVVENYMGDINISVSSSEDTVSGIGTNSLLGSYLDPSFGQTNASFSFQVKLPANKLNFNAQSIQNIYLNIPYIDFYGKTSLNPNNIEFTFFVSQLNENIVDVDTTSNMTNFLSTPLYTTNQTLASIQESNSLKLNFTESGFGLNEILNLNEADLENNENFLEAFNGFKLEVEPITSDEGGIMYFDTSSDSAFLHVEYTNIDGLIDTVNFEIGSQTKLNYFTHDYTGITEDSTLILLQSMGGLSSNIEINGLTELKNNGYIAVNNAELILAVDEDANSSFPLPETLLIDADPSIGGVLDSLSNTYTFNISNYVANIITEEIDEPILKLYTAFNTSNANRVILSNSNLNPIQLDLILIKEADN